MILKKTQKRIFLMIVPFSHVICVLSVLNYKAQFIFLKFGALGGVWKKRERKKEETKFELIE